MADMEYKSTVKAMNCIRLFSIIKINAVYCRIIYLKFIYEKYNIFTSNNEEGISIR